MIELILIVLILGFMLSTHSMLTIVNPFVVYFLMWLSVLSTYYISKDSYVAVQNGFWGVLFISKLCAILILFINKLFFKTHFHSLQLSEALLVRERYIFIGQLVGLISTPFIYAKAVQLSDGANIFSIIGYIRLRAAMTEDGQTYGFHANIMLMTYAISSIRVFQYLESRKNGLLTLISVLNGLFFVYLSTGRTFALLFLTLLFVPAILTRKIRTGGVVLIFFLGLIMFAVITIMTAKGINLDLDFTENVLALSNNLRAYIVAPTIAMSKLMDNQQLYDYGTNSLRTMIAILNALNIVELPPQKLIKDYVLVPDPTNVYTVYEIYYRDFSYFGFLFPPVFLIIHSWIFKRAVEVGGGWIFHYSLMFYPLTMQFFQDQYFSLLSMLLQLVFWFLIFVKSNK